MRWHYEICCCWIFLFATWFDAIRRWSCHIFFKCWKTFNPSGVSPTKWSNTLKTIRRQPLKRLIVRRMQKRIFEKIKFYIVKRNIIHISCSVWCTFYRNDIKKVLSIFIFENLWNTNPKLNTNNEVAEILFLKCNSNFISKAMYLLLFLFYKLWRVGYKFHKVIDAKIRSTAVYLAH